MIPAILFGRMCSAFLLVLLQGVLDGHGLSLFPGDREGRLSKSDSRLCHVAVNLFLLLRWQGRANGFPQDL